MLTMLLEELQKKYYILKILVQKILVWTICPKLFWSEFYLVQSVFKVCQRSDTTLTTAPDSGPVWATPPTAPLGGCTPGSFPGWLRRSFAMCEFSATGHSCTAAGLDLHRRTQPAAPAYVSHLLFHKAIIQMEFLTFSIESYDAMYVGKRYNWTLTRVMVSHELGGFLAGFGNVLSHCRNWN